MRVIAGIWIAVLLVAPAGCGSYTRPLTAEREKSAEERNFDAVWDASMKVLRKHYFVTDRRDRRAGVITTLPMTGKHFFEFWRRDSATARDLAESSIQTIYRTAVVTIRPAGGAPAGVPGGPSVPPRTFEPSVRITVARSSLSQAQITSTSEAYSMFTGDEDEGEDLHRRTGDREGIVPLGRDRNLEAKIEAEIRQAVAAGAALPLLAS